VDIYIYIGCVISKCEFVGLKVLQPRPSFLAVQKKIWGVLGFQPIALNIG
jgi:hypothetical protein